MTEGDALAILKSERGISDETIAHFGIEYRGDKNAWVFPANDAGQHKYKKVDRSAAAEFKCWCDPGTPNTFYYNGVPLADTTIFWVNGEPAVWSMREAGIAACCGLFGEGKVPLDAANALRALRASRVVVVADADDMDGKKALAPKTARFLADEGFDVEVVQVAKKFGPKGDLCDVWIQAAKLDPERMLKGLEYMREKQTVPSWSEMLTPATSKNGKERAEEHDVRLRHVSELLEEEFPPLEWTAKGMIPKNGLVLLHGPSESGKTIILYSLAIASAIGGEWMDRVDVMQGAWLLWDEENGPKRMQDRLKRLGATAETPIYIMSNEGVMLTDPKAMEWLLSECVRLKIVNIGIDTVIAVHDLDENKANEIRKLRAVFRPFNDAGITILAVIHDRKGDGTMNAKLQEIAGSRDYGAMADAAWQMTRVEAGTDEFRLECTKLRDGSRADTEVYHVEIFGKEGEPLTVSAKAGEASATMKQTRYRKKVLDALEWFWYQPGEQWATKSEIGEQAAIKDPRLIKIGIESLLKERMNESRGEQFLFERTRDKEEGEKGPKAKEYRLNDGYLSPSSDS